MLGHRRRHGDTLEEGDGGTLHIRGGELLDASSRKCVGPMCLLPIFTHLQGVAAGDGLKCHRKSRRREL
jgi:hypothetical protein